MRRLDAGRSRDVEKAVSHNELSLAQARVGGYIGNTLLKRDYVYSPYSQVQFLAVTTSDPVCLGPKGHKKSTAGNQPNADPV